MTAILHARIGVGLAGISDEALNQISGLSINTALVICRYIMLTMRDADGLLVDDAAIAKTLSDLQKMAS